MGFVRIVVVLLKAFFCLRSRLVAENLALRQELVVLQRTGQRPRLRKRDRIFWTWLSRFWTGCRSALLIVQPETVVRWHRQGFRLYWRWKLRNRHPGRVRRVLQQRRAARVCAAQRAIPHVRRAAREGQGRCRALPQWPASSLYACCLT